MQTISFNYQYLHQVLPAPFFSPSEVTVALIVLICLFIIIKPENLYFASRPGLEVKPLGVYPLGPRSSFCDPTKGTLPPRNTLRAN